MLKKKKKKKKKKTIKGKIGLHGEKNSKNRVRLFGLWPRVSFCSASASAKNFHFGASLTDRARGLSVNQMRSRPLIYTCDVFF